MYGNSTETALSSVLVSLVTPLDILHVVSRVETHPTILPSLAPALLVLVLQLLELLAWKSVIWWLGLVVSSWSSPLTSFEGKFVRFSCLVVVESPDRQPWLAVICQHVLAVIFVKLLVIEWIGILRTVAETFKQLAISTNKVTTHMWRWSSGLANEILWESMMWSHYWYHCVLVPGLHHVNIF